MGDVNEDHSAEGVAAHSEEQALKQVKDDIADECADKDSMAGSAPPVEGTDEGERVESSGVDVPEGAVEGVDSVEEAEGDDGAEAAEEACEGDEGDNPEGTENVCDEMVQNEQKAAALISNVQHVSGNVKHVPTGHEDSEEGGGVDGGEVGPAAFAEDAANNSVEEDPANTTADSQDGDDDVHSEHHKPYGGDDKAQEDAHHKAALMLGVSADIEHQSAAQSDPSQDPGKNKRPPGRPKGAKDSRPRTRRRKAEISAIRNATAAGMPVGMGMGFPHHQVFQHHHHMGGGHDMALQGMHGMDMSAHGYPRPGFQGLRNMWGGQDGGMGDMSGMVQGMSYKSIADPSGRSLSQAGGGGDGSVWSRGAAQHPGAGGVGGFADSVHMNSMYGGVDPYGFPTRGAGAGAGMYAEGHYDARYAPAAQQYSMGPMMMTSAMAMKQQQQQHGGGGGHPSGLGRPHSYGQHMRPGGQDDQGDVAGHDGQV